MNPAKVYDTNAKILRVVRALKDWQHGKIDMVECAELCEVTNAEWLVIWPRIARDTPPSRVLAIVVGALDPTRN